MKITGIAFCLVWVGLTAAIAESRPQGHPGESVEQRDARMAWWREAKYGMFIHWGLYAQLAGYRNGEPAGAGYGEWIMSDAKIPMAEYAGHAPDFNPAKFNAEGWVKLVKDSGMKYLVITAKHHEGFAMFRSKVDGFNIFEATPFKRDPIAELAEACRKNGIKFGLYYSQDLDWHHPGGGGAAWDPTHEGDPDRYIDGLVIPQVKEILSNYGEISVLWWDIGGINQERADRIYRTVMEINPKIIMNNRLGGGYPGDTETPEQQVPPTGYPGRDWETCMTINNTWGYKKDDQAWKSTENLLRNLVDIVSKGGNYLLNVGPDGEGSIPEPEVERLREVGGWLAKNGEAIYGTKGSPFPTLSTWGRVTMKGTRMYLHIFGWPLEGKVFLPMQTKVRKAFLLDGGKSVEVTQTKKGLEVSLPATAPDPLISVVALELEGPPILVPPQTISQEADGSLVLKADDAVLSNAEGKSSCLQLEYRGGQQNIGYWTEKSDRAEWNIAVRSPGNYRVTAEYAVQGNAAFTLFCGETALDGELTSTGSWEHFASGDLGVLELGAKTNKISLKAPTSNIRMLRLVPVAP